MPAVWYQYSPGRAGKYPREHLKTFAGTLQVDGYAGFNKLFRRGAPAASARITEVGCWAHARRGFSICTRRRSPRLQRRPSTASPCFTTSKPTSVARHPKSGSRFARNGLCRSSTRYMPGWCGYARRSSDARHSPRLLIRGAAVGKKNYLFFGSDAGGQHAAVIYGLIETCKLNHIDPQRYLEYVLERIADHRISDIEELLPWNVADKLNQPEQVSQALAA